MACPDLLSVIVINTLIKSNIKKEMFYLIYTSQVTVHHWAVRAGTHSQNSRRMLLPVLLPLACSATFFFYLPYLPGMALARLGLLKQIIRQSRKYLLQMPTDSVIKSIPQMKLHLSMQS